MEQREQSGFFIVLVDDEPRIHTIIREVLEQARLVRQFESFYDPLAFIEFLKKQRPLPDVVLLDVHFENSGLSGIEILPYIREEHPYLPVILLTGMESEEIERAQEYECLYYIPKPVSPDQLVRMVRFYLSTGRKSGERAAELTSDLEQHKQLVQTLKTELAQAEINSWDSDKKSGGQAEQKAFRRIMDILHTVVHNCELMPGLTADLELLFESDFQLFKKAVDTIVRFDTGESASPGMHVHKYHIAPYVYSLYVTQKARLFFYQIPATQKKRLVRLDPEHNDKAMDKWFKENRAAYEE